jgi:hypothetical protein
MRHQEARHADLSPLKNWLMSEMAILQQCELINDSAVQQLLQLA